MGTPGRGASRRPAGRCGHWAFFFADALLVQGILSEVRGFRPILPLRVMHTSAPAQNTPTPWQRYFEDHGVDFVDTDFDGVLDEFDAYDPSYGVGATGGDNADAVLMALENYEMGRYSTSDFLDIDENNWDYWEWRSNNPDACEVEWWNP